ncbi:MULTISPECIES: fumarylacetoacetate hydrolase family protein [unclassified Microbacterium]|uniref:fumarylacetoacetate hydrolase family protein n=1 Tax=unclassified Microbacterium TaxID=2609290 RepID=UPI000C2BA191|nr:MULTISPECIES: fumarylacetoacetate hydrolase family protein [unclassified Microbacterium]
MYLASIVNRPTIFVDGAPVDVHDASGGRFPAGIADIYEVWDEFRAWASEQNAGRPGDIDVATLGAPSPRPSQVFAISLNYLDHAEEASLQIPDFPSVFTKFPSCIGAPAAPVEIARPMTDWELELVVVIGREGHLVSDADGWDHVAGLTIGQDISDRELQLAGPSYPQFSLGKSFPGYGPTGPWLVSPDEFDNRDDIALRCILDGEVVQDFRTSNLIFSIPRLVSLLSSVVTLRPGDLIFTGTSSGVGFARTPKRFLAPGQEIVSEVEGIGALRTTLVASGS